MDLVFESPGNNGPIASLYEASTAPTLGQLPTADAAWSNTLTGFDDDGVAYNALVAKVDAIAPEVPTELTHTTTFIGAATTATTTWRLAKMGKLVIAHMTTVCSGTTTAAGYFDALTKIPAPYSPTSLANAITTVGVGGTNVVANVYFYGDGGVRIFAGLDPTQWPVGATAYSFGPINASWFAA